MATTLFFFLVSLAIFFPPSLSLPTFSISHTPAHTLVCAILPSSSSLTFLKCANFSSGSAAPNLFSFPGVPVSSVAGGNGFVIAVVPLPNNNATSTIRFWRFSANGTLLPFYRKEGTPQSSKRVYFGPPPDELSAGPSHLCGVISSTRRLDCWQWANFHPPDIRNLSGLAVGGDFVCGLTSGGNAECLGPDSDVTGAIPAGSFKALAAGDRRACGLNAADGSLQCWGPTSPAPPPPAGEFESVALSGSRACAIRRDGTAVCWSDEPDFRLPEELVEYRFVTVNGNGGVFCGVLNRTYALVCWGDPVFGSAKVFDRVQPGSCRTQCRCSLPNIRGFCLAGEQICGPCWVENGSPPSPSCTGCAGRLWKGKTALLVVGAVGSAIGAASLGFFSVRFCKRRSCRIHDSGRFDEEIPPPPAPSPASHLDQPDTSTRYSSGGGSRIWGRSQRGKWLARWRSGSSRSNRRVLSLPEEFPLEALRRVTNNFSEEHKIGSGSFGSVYRATLEDGRDVAIKRAEISSSSSYAVIGEGAGIGALTRRREKESAFRTELALLSRVNHKNLVHLLGFCEERGEGVLVYDYMPNGTLHHHLHQLDDSPLVAWTRRIKVALDAARGIEYLHSYAVNPIIHRDIKSSNILLDASWTAKVADFGLSLFGPSDGVSPLSLRAAGTVGYMDPEYYRRQRLTAKSDVYSFGVVLLELLSGMRAIHRVGQSGHPRNLVDHMVPHIVADNLHRVLDPRVPPPTPCEVEAVNSVGCLAADCVLPDGRYRPTMTEIVAALEKALVVCLTLPTLPLRSSSSSDQSRPSTADIVFENV